MAILGWTTDVEILPKRPARTITTAHRNSVHPAE